jgi:hypothetical protein
MKTRICLSILIGISIVLVTFLMTSRHDAMASIGLDPDGHIRLTEKTSNHDSPDNWQTISLKDGTECEGLVFDSIEDAEASAIEIGCSGYHEHHKEDQTILYMPCSFENVDAEDIKAELLDALIKGAITQEQFDEKLAWLKAKSLD